MTVQPSVGYQAASSKSAEPNLDIYSSYKYNVEMRVGLHRPFLDCHVEEAIDEAKKDNFSFVVIPLQHPRYYPKEQQSKLMTIADKSVASATWKSRIVLDLNHLQVDCCKQQTLNNAEKLFNNALYLNSTTVIIDCPTTQSGCTNLASIINKKLRSCPIINPAINLPLILLRVKIGSYESAPGIQTATPKDLAILDSAEAISPGESSSSSNNNLVNNSYPRELSDDSGAGDCSDVSNLNSPWHLWNNLRDYLEADLRLGVCLVMEGNLPSQVELDRWSGEPVYVIFVPVDNFLTNKGGHPVLLAAHQRFILKIARSMSLRFSLVLTGSNWNAHPWKAYTGYLRHLLEQARKGTIQDLLDFNDTLQVPLQPLASNLESTTYETFEVDVVKYIKYRKAIEQALLRIAAQKNVYPHKDVDEISPADLCYKDPDVTFNILVVGAGRGPLVEACIEAGRKSHLFCQLNIYAVEKNPNSIVTLDFRNKTEWSSGGDGLLLRHKVTVVETDMRKFRPPEKAEIIISELLGSLSDNELSPECLDGVWQAVIPRAISIPNSYCSHIEPIHCPRLHSKVKANAALRKAFDCLYVVRLSNYYKWDRSQPLFAFSHEDLSLKPETRDNYRYKKLYFISGVDVLCHGFAGYFHCNLFGEVNLSTVPGTETPDMYSWFPSYIPIEKPVFVKANQVLIVEFWRKHNEGKVWYEWVVTSPSRSRIHSMEHTSTALWKFI